MPYAGCVGMLPQRNGKFTISKLAYIKFSTVFAIHNLDAQVQIGELSTVFNGG